MKWIGFALALVVAANLVGSLWTVDRVERALHLAAEPHQLNILKGANMVQFSEVVTCNGRSVTVTTTCAQGESPQDCWARHQASVDAAKRGMGC